MLESTVLHRGSNGKGKHRMESNSVRIDPNTLGGRVFTSITTKGYRNVTTFLSDLKDDTGIDIKGSNFSMFLRGEKGMGRERLNAISSHLDVSLDYLMKGEISVEETVEFKYRQTGELVGIVDSITDDLVRDRVLLEVHRLYTEWRSGNERLARVESLLSDLSNRLTDREVSALKQVVCGGSLPA